MSFQATCHCEKVAVSVDEAMPTKGMVCNCSICRRKGNIHHFTCPEKATIKADEADLSGYEFNEHKIRHQFCKHCGCAPFARGEGPSGPMVEINLRCVVDCVIEKLEIQHYDGASS